MTGLCVPLAIVGVIVVLLALGCAFEVCGRGSDRDRDREEFE